MTDRKIRLGEGRKATCLRVLSSVLIEEVKEVIDRYKQVPKIAIPQLFHITHGKYLDTVKLGFDNGYSGLFREIESSISGDETENGIMISLKKINRRRILEPKLEDLNLPVAELTNPIVENLFRPNNNLWVRTSSKYLRPGFVLKIPRSAFEIATERNPIEFSEHVANIRRILQSFKDGILMVELNKVISINKPLFLATSIEQLTQEHPEVFYRQQTEFGPRLFDARTCSVDLTTTLDLERTKLICQLSILSGYYQKSLLLVREAGQRGLKLAVWRKAMSDNFSIKERRLGTKVSKWQRFVTRLSPLLLSLSLNSLGMIRLATPANNKNDLRIFLPQQAMDLNLLLSKRWPDQLRWKFGEGVENKLVE